MTDIVIGCSGSDRLCFGSIPRAVGGILDLAGDSDKLDILGLLDVTILVSPGQDERIACGHLSSTTGRFDIGTRIISKCCGDTTIDHDAVILAAIFSDKQS